MTKTTEQKIELKSRLDAVIETERLVMRSVAPEYAEKIFSEFTKEITRFMYPSEAQDISETQDFITDARGRMQAGTDIFVSIFNKSTGEFLGGAGLHHLERMTPELGVWIRKGAHGQKFGQEAVFGLKCWADENIKYEYLLYPVATENIASRKIPESLGGQVVREFVGKKQNGEEMNEVEYYIYPNND